MKTIENYWDLDKTKIKERYTEDEQGELHGLYECWYDSGELWVRSNYEHGNLHGLYEYWYEHGQLWKRCNYEQDNLHGLYEWWDANGQLWVRCNYEHGELHGLYERWDEHGQLMERCYYEHGKKIVTNEKIIQTQHNISLYEAKIVQLGERLHSALESNNSTAYRAIEEEIKKTQQNLKDEFDLLDELN